MPIARSTVIDLAEFRHARALAGSREAKLASRPAVRPAERAVDVAKMTVHHSEGIRPRWNHLRIAGAPAPISEAMASMDGQRVMTVRKESILDIDSSLGQFVLNSKANLSHDCGQWFEHNWPMPGDRSETEEAKRFIARVRAAREAKFRTQKPVYKYLGVDQDHYKHWETTREMPRRFIPKFCTVTEVSYEWLLAEEGEGPAVIIKTPRGRKTA